MRHLDCSNISISLYSSRTLEHARDGFERTIANFLYIGGMDEVDAKVK